MTKRRAWGNQAHRSASFLAAAAAALLAASCSGNLLELIHDSVDPIAQVQVIDVPSSTSSWRFGTSVVIAGDAILVSDPLYGNSSSVSRAFLYLIKEGAPVFLKEIEPELSDGTGYISNQSIGLESQHFAIAYRANYIDINGDPCEQTKLQIYSQKYPTPGDWGYVMQTYPSDTSVFGISSTCAMTEKILSYGQPDAPGRGRVRIFFYGTTFMEGWNPTFPEYYEWGAPEDRFGASMSGSGTDLLVGAPGVDGASAVPGAAMVLSTLEGADAGVASAARLIAPNLAPGDAYGCAVSLSEGCAVVGANRDDGHGSAYVFFRDQAGQWGMQAKLEDPADAAGDAFGSAVAVSGDYAVIGDPQAVVNGARSGCAYLYKREGTDWLLLKPLSPDSPRDGMRFGCSLSASGSRIAVGAPGCLVPGTAVTPEDYRGAVYVYTLRQ